MKVELHLHTMRFSGCALCTPADMVTALVANDYHAVYITEHDAVWPENELKLLRKQFPSIRIFPGMELSLHSGGHLLVLGSNDKAYLKMNNPGEIMERAKKLGHRTILAHPYRWAEGDAILQSHLMPDAIEYLTNNHDAACGLLARAAAERFCLPLVNAGDCHSIDMVNRFWIETEIGLTKAKDIRRIILEGLYRNCARA